MGVEAGEDRCALSESGSPHVVISHPEPEELGSSSSFVALCKAVGLLESLSFTFSEETEA